MLPADNLVHETTHTLCRRVRRHHEDDQIRGDTAALKKAVGALRGECGASSEAVVEGQAAAAATTDGRGRFVGEGDEHSLLLH